MSKYVIILVLPPPIQVQKGGCSRMDPILSFYLSVMASVVAYYICKWLDGDD